MTSKDLKQLLPLQPQNRENHMDHFAYISTGSQSAMYTLRVVHDEEDSFGRIIRKTSYIKNLSTSWEKALARANHFCAKNNIVLATKDSFDLNKIHRSFRGDKVLKLVEEEKEKEKEENLIAQQIAQNVFVKGKYEGKTPSEINDIDYIRYMASMHSEKINHADGFAINAKIAYNYLQENPIPESEFLSYNVNDKIDSLSLVLKKVIPFKSFYGVSYLFSCEANGKDKVVFFSTSKKLLSIKEESTFKVNAIVKTFDVRNNEKQTILTRTKLL